MSIARVPRSPSDRQEGALRIHLQQKLGVQRKGLLSIQSRHRLLEAAIMIPAAQAVVQLGKVVPLAERVVAAVLPYRVFVIAERFAPPLVRLKQKALFKNRADRNFGQGIGSDRDRLGNRGQALPKCRRDGSRPGEGQNGKQPSGSPTRSKGARLKTCCEDPILHGCSFRVWGGRVANARR